MSREQGTGNRTASRKGLKGFVGLGLAPSRCAAQNDCWRRETSPLCMVNSRSSMSIHGSNRTGLTKVAVIERSRLGLVPTFLYFVRAKPRVYFHIENC